jgi:hypothetical protein
LTDLLANIYGKNIKGQKIFIFKGIAPASWIQVHTHIVFFCFLTDIMQNTKIDKSSLLASSIQDSSCNYLTPRYTHIKNRGVKTAPFYVLLGARMPAILIETSFISNPRECKRLRSAKLSGSFVRGYSKRHTKICREIEIGLINVSEILQLFENTGLSMATCLCHQNGIMECWNIGSSGGNKPF